MALRTKVSPFPSLMKGVFSCLRSYPFLFFPASPGGTALANCWLVLSQPHWLVLSQPHLAVLLWQPHWLVLSQPHWLVLSQPHLAVLLWQTAVVHSNATLQGTEQGAAHNTAHVSFQFLHIL